MPGTTLNQKGEILVTTPDVSKIETSSRSAEELLELVVQELRRANLYLSVLAGTEISPDDVEKL